MAGYGGHRGGCLDGRLPKEVQAQLGLLVISTEQCAVDRLGLARQGLRTHCLAVTPGAAEHTRRDEE